MRPSFCSLLLTWLLISASGAKAFVNLNLESALVVSNDPFFGFLDWAQAVPGWSHSSGSDTSAVYYRDIHVGTTQWFVLADDTLSGTIGDRSLQGRYSMLLHSGYFSSSPSAWVDAAIWQSGLIPADTHSITLQGEGSFSVYVNGSQVAMNNLGGNLYGGDISSYAGTNSEIKIAHTVTAGQYSSALVDNISFSTAPAPEPSKMMLLALGLMALITRRQRHASLR